MFHGAGDELAHAMSWYLAGRAKAGRALPISLLVRPAGDGHSPFVELRVAHPDDQTDAPKAAAGRQRRHPLFNRVLLLPDALSAAECELLRAAATATAADAAAQVEEDEAL